MTNETTTLIMSPLSGAHLTNTIMMKQNQTCNNDNNNNQNVITETTEHKYATNTTIKVKSTNTINSDSNSNVNLGSNNNNNNNNQTSVLKNKSEDDEGEDTQDQETQENVNIPTLIEPLDHNLSFDNTTQSTINQEQREGEDQISKRIFTTKLKGAEELKKALLISKNKHSSSNLFKLGNHKSKGTRKNKKKNKIKTRMKTSTTTTQQRQAVSTTTTGYGSLLNPNRNFQQDSSSLLNNNNKPLSTTLKEHFPSLATPINLSTAVQRLIMNKLNSALTSSSSPASSNNHQNSNLGNTPSASYEQPTSVYISGNTGMQKQNLYIQQPGSYPSSLGDDMAYKDHIWDPSKDHHIASYSATDQLPPTTAGVDDNSNKPIIPIEIIGLDPAVTSSILFSGQNDFLSSSRPQSPVPVPRSPSPTMYSSYNKYNNDNIYGPSSNGGGPPKASSVLHVHHFHMEKNPTAAETSKLLINHQPKYYNHQSYPLMGQQQQQQIEQQQQDYSGSQQQQQQQQQVFMNDKGELVYLSLENQGVSDEQSEQQQQQVTENQEAPQKDQQQQQATSESSSDDTSSTTATIYPIQQELGSDNQPAAGEYSNHNNDGTTITAGVAMAADGSPRKPKPSDPKQQQQLVMVGYKPLESHPHHNQTSENNYANSGSSAYANDGQESKSSSISTKITTSQTANNNRANELTLFPLQAVGSGAVATSNNHHNSSSSSLNNNNNNIDLTRAKLRSLLSQVPGRITLQSENRVPTLLSNNNNNKIQIKPISNSMMKMQMLRPTNNEQAYGDSNGSWLFSNNDVQDKFQLSNGYTSYNNNKNRLYPFGFKNVTAFWQNHKPTSQQQQQQKLIESLALFKKLQLQQQQQQLNNNFNHDNLIQILQNEMKLNADNFTTSANFLHNHRTKLNMTDQQVLNALAHLNFSKNINNGLQHHPQQLGRFEMTQASNLIPPRYSKTQTNNNNNHNHNFLTHQYYHNQNNANNNPVSSPSGKLNLDLVKHAGATTEEVVSSETGDEYGIGTVALAFSFVILLSFMVFLVSKFYRHRRRSIGRCSNLPGRSRLNLTQRTKHFMRSNFVKPNDVTTIHTINLESAAPKVDKLIGNSTNDCNKVISSKGTTNDKFNGVRKNKTFGSNKMSTFNTNMSPPSNTVSNNSNNNLCSNNNNNSDKYAFSPINKESQTDIKTLNTKLHHQKHPPYLKTLISSSSENNNSDVFLNSSNNNIKKHLHQLHNSNNNSSSDGYLNTKHKSSSNDNGPNKSHLKSSKSNANNSNIKELTKRSQSFKKMDSDTNSHAGYTSFVKNSSLDSLVNTDNKHEVSLPNDHISSSSNHHKKNSNTKAISTRMSTIHSVASNDNQHDDQHQQKRKQSPPNIVIRNGSKLNNIPLAPKNLVASPPHINYSNFDNRKHKHTSDFLQIDRL